MISILSQWYIEGWMSQLSSEPDVVAVAGSSGYSQ